MKLFRYVFLWLMAMVVCTVTLAQTATTSGDWDVGATWGGTVPASTASVTIPNGVVVSIKSAVSAANITVAAGGTLQVKPGSGVNTLTLASANTSTGNFAMNGTIDFVNGTDSVQLSYTSTHNNAKNFGGTGSIELAAVTVNHTASNGTASGTISSQTLTLNAAVNVKGSLTIKGTFHLQRACWVWGSENDATQNHVVENVILGSANTTTTVNTGFCFLGFPTSATIVNNTNWVMNNALRCSVTVEVVRNIVGSTAYAGATNSIAIGMTGPSALGGTISGQDAAAPHSNKTRLIVKNDMMFPGRVSISGNVVNVNAGITQPMDSLVIDVGRHFQFISSATFSACSKTFTAGFTGYNSGGFGHSGISYPVFKFRGGTAADPATIEMLPALFMKVTANTAAVDNTAHYRIEAGSYRRLKANSGIVLREGRRLTVNGTLDCEDGAMIISNRLGTCTSCTEPTWTFGTDGRIVCRDADVGFGLGTDLNTATTKGLYTRSHTEFGTNGTNANNNARVVYPGPASNVITAKTYRHLVFDNAAETFSLPAGTTTLVNNGTLEVKAGTLRLNPAGTTTFTIGTTSTLVVNNGATLQTNGVSLANFNNHGDGTKIGARGSRLLTALGGTIVFNGTGAETLPIGNYNNIIVQKPGQTLTMTAADTSSIRGTLQLNSGTFSMPASGVLELWNPFNGLGGSPTGTFTPNSSCGLMISGESGTGSMTIPSQITGTVASLGIDRVDGVNCGHALTVSSALNLQRGVLNPANLSLAANGTVNRWMGTLSADLTTAGAYSLTYNQPTTPLTSGPEWKTSTAPLNVTVNANANLALAGSRTVGGAMTVATGASFDIGANTLSFSATTGNILTTTGTGAAIGGSSSHITLTGSTTTTTNLGLIRNGVGNLTTARAITLTASLQINGDLNVTPGRNITLGANRLTINGQITGSPTLVFSGTSVLHVTGSGPLFNSGSLGFSGNPGSYRYTRTGHTFVFGANFTTDTLEVGAGSTVDISGRTMTIGRTCLVSGTVTHTAASNLIINDVGANQPQWQVPSALNSYAGILSINRATGARLTAPISLLNLRLLNGVLEGSSNLTIPPGGSLLLGLGDFDGTPSIANAVPVTIGSGTSSKVRTLNLSRELAHAPALVTINNNGLDVTLAGDKTFPAGITCTSGKLILNGGNLTIPAGATVGYSASSYIVAENNYLIRHSIGSTAQTFPVGSMSTLSPARITNSGGALEARVRVLDKVCARNETSCTQNVPDVVNKTWDIDILSGTPNATLDMGWVAASETGTFNRANQLAIYRFNSSINRWQPTNATTLTGGNIIAGCVGTIRVTNKTQFSPHAISEENAPLPVTLAAFTARRVGTGALLNWTTVTELNNRGWHIERSTDGVVFETIGFVAGIGTSRTQQSYSFKDEVVNTTAYYRLKQDDLDGTSEYSPTVHLTGGKLENVQFSILPNPSRGLARLHFIGALDAQVLVTATIVDASGKVVASREGSLVHAAGLLEDVSEGLASGVYAVRIMTLDNLVNLKWVKE